MSLSFARVDWFDPRAVAQRAAMDAETGAMYAEFTASVTPEQRVAIDEALTVDPADIVVTLLAIEGDDVAGHAALRPVVPSASSGRRSSGSTHNVASPVELVETPDTLEVKKVFVGASHRGKGISRALMLELEEIARARGATSLVLQTGPLQVPAIRLYESLGYELIPPYGQYGVIPGALCYRKVIA